MLVPIDESKGTLKKYEELWNKIRDLIRSIANSLDYYDEKYLKIYYKVLTFSLEVNYHLN